MVVQQIHSLRWIGVRAFHFASRSALDIRTARMSSGTSCSTPAATCVEGELSSERAAGFAVARGALGLPLGARCTVAVAPPALDLFMLAFYALRGFCAAARMGHTSPRRWT
jgi:hypothetical protein